MTPLSWWPQTPDATLLWAELVAVWSAAAYLPAVRAPLRWVYQRRERGGPRNVPAGRTPATSMSGGDQPPNRTAALSTGPEASSVETQQAAGLSAAVPTALLAAAMVGWGARGLMLGVALGALVWILPRSRTRSGVYNRRTEVEIVFSAAAVVATAAGATAGGGSGLAFAIGTAPIGTRQLTAASVAIAAALAGVVGGGNVVRDVLERAGAIPDSGRPASGELRRGRVIGYMERFIIIAVIAAGHYDALGFLIAAKGLIRSNELADHQRAEYFLVGTLTSTAIGVTAGLCIRAAYLWLWVVAPAAA